mgnify:FL=1|jgi:Fic family protein
MNGELLSRHAQHKSSTANFKTSRRKLNDLARLIAGRTADEAILQLQASEKKQAPRLLSMVALARDHAMAKGLKREELVVGAFSSSSTSSDKCWSTFVPSALGSVRKKTGRAKNRETDMTLDRARAQPNRG